MEIYNAKEMGQRIQEIRINVGLTQEQLAEIVGVGEKYFTYIETGKKSCSIDIFMIIVQALGTTADYLLFGEKGKKKQENKTCPKEEAIKQAIVLLQSAL